MGFLATFHQPAGIIRSAAAGTPAQGLLPILGSTPSATGLQINQASAMSVSTVYACVTIRAKDVARCRPSLRKAGAPRDSKPFTGHPLAKLLRRPNRIQTWFEFVLQMQAALLLRNNAYAVILRDANGRPTQLIPVNPDAVMVLEAVDGSIFYQVNRVGLFQLAMLRDLPVSIPEEDILHLRGLTFNMLVGANTIALARDSIGVALGLEQQVARFMANGARPSGVLQTAKTLSLDAAQRLRDQWEALRSGLANVGRTAILEDGLEWKEMQLSGADLQLLEQRKFSREEVALWWGVPLHKLNVPAENARIKVSDAEQNYVNTTIMPDLELWEQKFAQVFALDDDDLEIDFDERNLLRAAEAERVNVQRLKVMSGLATQNECRAEEGKPPKEGGDVLLHPVNLAASGSDMSGTAGDGAGRPSDGEPAMKAVRHDRRTRSIMRAPARRADPSAAARMREAAGASFVRATQKAA
ncbi:phage portal protein [Bradyrhizobium sp. SZCCHNRI1003]|uniref:phage portal protein n=1 Tax=Bradyrhizobium sp. SZCCHNRI1003 TaxID=3057275 RepID=UPI002915F02A|nr:phage portal protein [Bradyrhizobium sp. SZCCHNRI1003]